MSRSLEQLLRETDTFYQFIMDCPCIIHLLCAIQYPFMMDSMICDKGAIKHIFSGSHVMAPGLTSEGGTIPDKSLEKGAPIALFAEGKKHALAIGYLS